MSKPPRGHSLAHTQRRVLSVRDTALCAAVDSADSGDIITRHMLGLATSVTAVARVSPSSSRADAGLQAP